MCFIHKFVVVAVAVIGATISAFATASGHWSTAFTGGWIMGIALGYYIGWSACRRGMRAETVARYRRYLDSEAARAHRGMLDDMQRSFAARNAKLGMFLDRMIEATEEPK